MATATDNPTTSSQGAPHHDRVREGENKGQVQERETLTRDTDLSNPRNSVLALADRNRSTVSELPGLSLSDKSAADKSSTGGDKQSIGLSKDATDVGKKRAPELPEGVKITKDDDGRVSSIQYANGDKREFGYGRDGKVSSVTENGKTYTVDPLDGHMHDPYGRDIGFKDPVVSSDGKYTYRDTKNTYTTINPDRSSDSSMRDYSSFHKDPDGHTTRIDYPDGRTRTFGYDEKGNLSSFTDRDGKEFKFNGTYQFGVQVGSFEAKDGSKMSNVKLADDGTLSYQDKTGHIHSDFMSGGSTVTSKTADELRDRAKQAADAGSPNADGSGYKKALNGLTPADRVALDEQYRQQYGESLSQSLQRTAENPAKAKNANEALASMNEAKLRVEVQKDFAGDSQQLAAANKAIDAFQKRAKDQHVPADKVAEAESRAFDALRNPDEKTFLSSDRVRQMDNALTNAAPTLESLNTKYGVKYDEEKGKDGQKTRHYYVAGEDGQKLPVVDTKGDNPAEIEKQLRDWRDNKAGELEKKYNIQFTKDGTFDSEKGVNMRAPKIDELLALQEGFKHSESSTSTLNGRPVLVQFAEKPTTPYDAYVQPRPDGQSRILFEPLTRNFAGLRDTILHEWTHNAQNNMKVKDPAALSDVYGQMGYRKVTTDNGQEQWQFRDNAGNYWTQQRKEFPFGSWNRVDEHGNPLKADGTPAKSFDDKDAAVKSNYEMRQAAAVKPPTEYFPNPGENGADSQKFFRANEKHRTELYMNDPTSYRAAKKFDQLDLDSDSRFGRNPDGSSKFIRLPNGDVAENNAANQKVVADYEAELQRRRSEIMK